MSTAESQKQPLFLNYAEAAKYTGLAEQYLRRLVAEGRIPHKKLSPHRAGPVRFSPAELDEWAKSLSVSPDA